MPLFNKSLFTRAETLLADYRKAGWKIATAESCTGGLITALLTEISGSSDVVERGFITYSNEAKSQLLGVPPALIETYGAVSEEVARAMAEGALKYSVAHISIAVTGIAGPGGGSAEKPVGLVYIASAKRGGEIYCKKFNFTGDRHAIRIAAVEAALGELEYRNKA